MVIYCCLYYSILAERKRAQVKYKEKKTQITFYHSRCICLVLMYFPFFHLNSKEKNRVFLTSFSSSLFIFSYGITATWLLIELFGGSENMSLQDRHKEGQGRELLLIECLDTFLNPRDLGQI